MEMEFDTDFYVEFWDKVKLTPDEINAMCDAADNGDLETANLIVDGAYDRLFGEGVH